MNAKTDITTLRANAVAFMTTEEAEIYLAECKAWDAQMDELAAATATRRTTEEITVSAPSRKLFTPATEKTVTVETVTIAEIREGDLVVFTGNQLEAWTVRATVTPFERSAGIYEATFGGSRDLYPASRTFRRLV